MKYRLLGNNIWGAEGFAAQDNLASLDLNLSADQVRSLDEASGIEMGFPYYLYSELVRSVWPRRHSDNSEGTFV